jgi:hypothetical protein
MFDFNKQLIGIDERQTAGEKVLLCSELKF